MKLPLLDELTPTNLKELSHRYEKSIKTLAPKAVDCIGMLVGLLPQFFTAQYLKLENGSVAIGNFPVLTNELSLLGRPVQGVITSMALLSREMKFGKASMQRILCRSKLMAVVNAFRCDGLHGWCL